MKSRLFLFAAVTALAWPIVHADDDLAAQGKISFGMHCARCHGAEAKGDGPDAKRLTVVPRDITSGKFKFKSTASGTPPTDDDIANGILGHGLAGSGMPSFGDLDKNVRAGLVAYIKTISPAFQNGQKPEPIPDPANKKASPDLAKGKEVFNKLQCGLCHGPNGHANGTSSFALVDASNHPIKVANLTQGWTYRGGSKPIDIYHRILAGIEGAPMPSYEGAASHEDIWQLCHYVASLQLKTNWSNEITATKVSGALPTKLDDALWQKAVRTDVNMQNYLYEGDHRASLTVNAVSVQAVYNESAIAFRIFWDDPVQNNGDNMSDALMIALKPNDFAGDTRSNLHTLYGADAPALDLMIWNASTPKAVAQNKSNLASATRSSWNHNQILESSAQYEDGRWTIMFTRPLELSGADKIDPASHDVRYVGFAAWDGKNRESGIKHSTSQWIRLALGSKSHGSKE